MDGAACAVGRIGEGGPWVGFAPTMDDRYALVIGGYDDLCKISRFTSALKDMLQYGFAGEESESFAWKSRRGKPGGDNAQNSLWHVRF